MPCLFLTGNYIFSCSALKEVYIPSSYELEEYCSHGQDGYEICPFYCKSETDKKFMRRKDPEWDRERAAESADAVQTQKVEPMNATTKSILLVETDFADSSRLSELLSGLGYKVARESDSRNMLFLLSEGMPIDLVVIDCRILDEDIENILCHIRHASPNVPVVVLSLDISIEKYLRTMSQGVYEYVNKPVSDEEIAMIVNMAIGASQTLRRSAAACGSEPTWK